MVAQAGKSGWRGDPLCPIRSFVFRALCYDGEYFESCALAEYFHKRRGIMELEVNSLIRLKSYEKVELQDQTHVRVRIEQLGPGMVGGRTVFVQMQALNAAPEPWEETRRGSVDPAQKTS